MKVSVFGSHTHMSEKEVRGKVAVVIDTLRATSTIITAMANGCSQVLPVEEVEQAMERKASMPESSTILGGERNALKVSGFDLGNSPLEYTAEVVSGKTLILTTSNGTQAISKAREASILYLGAMINGVTAASALLRAEKDVVLLCAGTHGYYSSDDILTAGYILYRLHRFGSNIEIELDDLGRAAMELYERAKDDLNAALKPSTHYQRLVEAGMEKDLEYCLKRDTVRILPVCRDGQITLT